MELNDYIIDLLVDFDEMEFAPTTLCPGPEAYAIEWRNKITKAFKELTEENAEVKANWQKLKDSYDNNDKEWREAYADSQSKWEKAYEKLELTLEGVMHFVDKWLDGAELEKDEVNRAITMREKTLQIVEKLTEENERLRCEVADLKIIDKEYLPKEAIENRKEVRECKCGARFSAFVAEKTDLLCAKCKHQRGEKVNEDIE